MMHLAQASMRLFPLLGMSQAHPAVLGQALHLPKRTETRVGGGPPAMPRNNTAFPNLPCCSTQQGAPSSMCP